jgi:hypothetical protein
MTLDEAIEHAKEVSIQAECDECKKQHFQLYEWLKELKTLKDYLLAKECMEEMS